MTEYFLGCKSAQIWKQKKIVSRIISSIIFAAVQKQFTFAELRSAVISKFETVYQYSRIYMMS